MRFLTYVVAAMQTLAPTLGAGALHALQSPQPPPVEHILVSVINELTKLVHPCVLVLDDYHEIKSPAVDHALEFLLQHLPAQLHLVVITREEPALPIARLRARNQLTELRTTDLRFTSAEAAEFLTQVMELALEPSSVAALAARTEGWVSGLQLAAISIQSHHNTARFMEEFTGSHHFVLSYLVEEVLHQQPQHVQHFLLATAVLDRLCASLCDAVMQSPAGTGQTLLTYAEQANLFIVPLDNQRRWYRYHHLFADLLRQRLHQREPATIATLHIRASQWYEANGFALEAFKHATAGNDLDRAERLMEGGSLSLHNREALNAIHTWLTTLPRSVLDARPLLWVRSATVALTAGQTTGVAARLTAAEAALQGVELDATRRNLIGQIAAARATLAVTEYQADTIVAQAQRALEYLPQDNHDFRFVAYWALGFAHLLQGERPAAIHAYNAALANAQKSASMFSTLLATSGLGQVQELENQLYLAAETYRRALTLAGELPLPSVADVHLGLARIYYEWNDLERAEHHGQQSLQLAKQYDSVIDRFILSEVLLARLKLARGELDAAAVSLEQSAQTVRQRNFWQQMPEVAAAQVVTLLQQGDIAAAAHSAKTHTLPYSQARVMLAQGNTAAAVALLTELYQQALKRGWVNEQLRIAVLYAVALQANGDTADALRMLANALALAEPGGCIRVFVDEGPVLADLLVHGAAQELHPTYIKTILAAFAAEPQPPSTGACAPIPAKATPQRLIEPLTKRELEVLRLIAEGRSNQEISAQLVLALDTVKGHNRRIYAKLQVKRRTEAILRARALGLL